jgi:hypothetical protein
MNFGLSYNRGVQICIVLMIAFLLLHLGIIIGILVFDYAPVHYLWGGRLSSAEELMQFEILAVCIQLVQLLIVFIAADRLRVPRLKIIARWLLWPMALMFLLNTVGNLLAHTAFEKGLSILTLLLFICTLRIAFERRKLQGTD